MVYGCILNKKTSSAGFGFKYGLCSLLSRDTGRFLDQGNI